MQSVAVKLIVDREREIEAFKTEEYWKITALLAKQGSGVAWTADPAKSKIFAKKKGETAKPVEWHKPTDADAVPDADEPVVDTESDGPTAEGEPASGRAGREGRHPDPARKPFLAELAKWDGAEPKLGNEAAADAIVAALAGRAVRRHQGRAEGPAGPAEAAVHHQHASAAGQHPAAVQHQPHDADGPEAVRGRRAFGQGQTALITYMRTDSTRVSNDALDGRARPSSRAIPARAEVPARDSRTSTPPARPRRKPTRRSARPT